MKFTTVFTRSPLRISFLGGGTDFKNFYERHGGYYVSMAINKHVYVQVKSHSTSFRENIRLNYSETELVENHQSLKNDIARETLDFYLKIFKKDLKLYIGTISDIRSNSGLGSSSAYTCGLVQALNVALLGYSLSAIDLAKKACEIEIERLGKQIGIQDQFASALGGLRGNDINKLGHIASRRVELNDNQLEAFEGILFIVDSKLTRKAESITKKFANPDVSQEKLLGKLSEEARKFAQEIEKVAPENMVDLISDALNTSQELKSKLDSAVMPQELLSKIDYLKQIGASGVKLSGAGGGGYFLACVPTLKQDQFQRILNEQKILFDSIRVNQEGTELLFKC